MATDLKEATLSTRVVKTQLIKWKNLKFIQQSNFKEWIDTGDKKLVQSLLNYNFIDPFKVWQDGDTLWCLDGFHRYTDLLKLIESGCSVPDKLHATFIDCKSKKEAAELVLVYSSIYAKITQDGLSQFLVINDLDYNSLISSIELPEFDSIDFESLINKSEVENDIVLQSLAEKFIIPPFSIFDTRQGYWQDRKRKWSKLFNSQETREDVELIAMSGQSSAIYELRNKMRKSLGRDPEWEETINEAKKRKMHIYEGASVFDPVLAEICYSWFCPPGGHILDPFAGGSVRGIVAGVLDFAYTGIDLRKDQVLANRQQWKEIQKYAGSISWQVGDSNVELDSFQGETDFVFSCPPYHDLEKYSDDPLDLSNMNYQLFLTIYQSIIKKSLARLKPNRFACFVVADIRDERGIYRNFVSDTIQAFLNSDEDGEVGLYNEIILINVAGSLPIRVGRQFQAGRKVGKMHQNVLVFYKGDPKKIKEHFPELNLGNVLEE